MKIRPLRFQRFYQGQFFAVEYGRSTYITHEGTWMIQKRDNHWRVLIHRCDSDPEVRMHAVCIHAGIYENEFRTRGDAVNALQTIVTAEEVLATHAQI